MLGRGKRRKAGGKAAKQQNPEISVVPLGGHEHRIGAPVRYNVLASLPVPVWGYRCVLEFRQNRPLHADIVPADTFGLVLRRHVAGSRLELAGYRDPAVLLQEGQQYQPVQPGVYILATVAAVFDRPGIASLCVVEGFPVIYGPDHQPLVAGCRSEDVVIMP